MNIETFDAPKGHTIEIHYDDHPESPREWGHDSTFWTFHSRYCSPDPDPDPDYDLSDCVWLPVFMYDHGGVAYNTTGFHCPWDSGCVGFIFIPKAKVREIHGWKRITKAREEQVKSQLKSEVEIYSQWANGQVYGFITKDPDGEEIDSCWGFYGFDYCIEEAKACI
jgi:hypothetical protein